MADLEGQIGELSFNLQITRKETGQVEDYTLTGIVTNEIIEDLNNGSNTLDSSAERGN